jgi:hypothetical protein
MGEPAEPLRFKSSVTNGLNAERRAQNDEVRNGNER